MAELGAKEFKLLSRLMENPERVFTKRQLFLAVWDDEYYYDDNPLRDIASSQYGLIDKVTFFCGKVRTYNDVYQRLYDIDLSEAYKELSGHSAKRRAP
ncbi:MAG TPA: helix-turn-helix domain-containing protein [Clostridiales bacterium]|nr:helix-turn-helix domain-containing protein [Clostridiales bacterium]